MSKPFDIVVIGAGPGGYIAAIRAAQLGFSVACCESANYDDPKNEVRLGGTCLNVGCIPSKALLASSETYEHIQHLEGHGIQIKGLSLQLDKMLQRKNDIVSKMTGGIRFLFKKNNITLFSGQASFVGRKDQHYQLAVKNQQHAEQVEAKHVIIATGSKARALPNVTIDHDLICDNAGALNFPSVPKKLGVIGAGVIGLELGSVWRRLGAQVSILEAMPEFLSACDPDLAQAAENLFRKQGLELQLGIKITAIKRRDHDVSVSYLDAQQKEHTCIYDRLICAVGRVPYTENLNLAAIGVNLDERGFIPVDGHCATQAEYVYAIGDVVRGPMLAHKAEDEGILVAERIAGQKPHLDYNCVPWVIYTAPEIAWVGQTEKQLQQAKRAYKQGRFPFAANGRALGMDQADGFIKILADQATDEILGVHIIGCNASELIAEAVLAMEFKASSEDIARTCHPHPSLSEVLREAALAVDKRALNM